MQLLTFNKKQSEKSEYEIAPELHVAVEKQVQDLGSPCNKYLQRFMFGKMKTTNHNTIGMYMLSFLFLSQKISHAAFEIASKLSSLTRLFFVLFDVKQNKKGVSGGVLHIFSLAKLNRRTSQLSPEQYSRPMAKS